jgi:hypothetical protein
MALKRPKYDPLSPIVPMKTLREIRRLHGATLNKIILYGGGKAGNMGRIDNPKTDVMHTGLEAFIRYAHGLEMTPGELLEELGLNY